MRLKTSMDVLQPQANAGRLLRGLLHPSTLLLLAANSLPIWGVLYWHWDVFVLLILYWLETAIIGFWMILRIALSPAGSLGTVEVNGVPRPATGFFMVAFFVVHAGMFMGVHMVFLWTLFSGEWSKQVHGLGDFYQKLVVNTDLWIPLLALFAVRGFSFLVHVVKPEAIERLERALGVPISSVRTPEDFGSVVGAFYGRVVVMHLTILGSAFIAEIFGTIAPLIITVVLKTIADVALHLKFDFSNLKKVSQTVTAVSST